jgi:hypothetical protein
VNAVQTSFSKQYIAQSSQLVAVPSAVMLPTATPQSTSIWVDSTRTVISLQSVGATKFVQTELLDVVVVVDD